MPSVVLDTVVFVRALMYPGGPAGRIIFELSARYRPVVSEPIVQEVLSVLSRPKLQRKYKIPAHLSLADVLRFLAEADLVEPHVVQSISRDPNDDMFLAAAFAARVDYLVSEDRDLLVLDGITGVRIIDTREFVRILTSG